MANEQKITIKKPFDAHVHFRRGAMLRAVVPHTAAKFSRAIVMPNTEPPIDTVEQAAEYKKEILSALSSSSSAPATSTHSNILQNVRMNNLDNSGVTARFEPLMTLYLTKNLTAKEVAKIAASNEKLIYGIKYYPWGYSINSQWGPRQVSESSGVLHEMELAGLPLLLHSEVHLNEKNEEEDPYDGEKLFLKDTLPRLLEKYPRLKISLEHISSKNGAEFIQKNGKEGMLVATITPHHLVYDRTDAFRGGYRALINCKPLVKRTEDRDALRELVRKGFPFVHAGTDSAPHPESKKFSSCCAFGVFNSPVALELYTQVFDELGALDKFEAFVSVNGPRFFGLKPAENTITLVKEDWQVTEPVVTEEGVKIWSMCDKTHGLGNEVIRWRINAD